MRLLISGGPGAGATTTGVELSSKLGVPVFDSDDYFHKPSDPPFREQFSREERRDRLREALAPHSSWILSGSVSTWRLESFEPTHGVFIDLPCELRLERLVERQRSQFGDRIDSGGDLAEEHAAFLHWASTYEERRGADRNRNTDLSFLLQTCSSTLEIREVMPLSKIIERISRFLTNHIQVGGLD